MRATGWVFGCLLAGAVLAKGPSKYLEDFEFIRDTVRLHGAAVRIKSKKIDWKAACARFRPLFRDCKDDVEHVKNCKRLLAVLHDSHTGVTRYSADAKRVPSKWDGLYGGGLWIGWDQGLLFLQGLMKGHSLTGAVPQGSALATIDVSVHLALPPPVIGWGPATFTKTSRGNDVSTDTLLIWNDGVTTLSYSIEAVPAGLVSVYPPDGTTTGPARAHTVRFDCIGLAAGDHPGTITIADSAATNSPIHVPVLVHVVVGLGIGDGSGNPGATSARSMCVSTMPGQRLCVLRWNCRTCPTG